MLWRCPVLCIFIFSTGTSLDVYLEPVAKTFTVVAGDPASFYCTVTGGDMKNYHMSWYKKNGTNALFLVYKLNSNSTDGGKSNLKGKINISKNQFILDIQKATMKDAGVESTAKLLQTTYVPAPQLVSGYVAANMTHFLQRSTRIYSLLQREKAKGNNSTLS